MPYADLPAADFATTSPSVRSIMRGNIGQDTRPEVAVRSELHRAGLRFRKHVRPVRALRCVADAVFPTERVALFVDGCFWHGCPEHGHTPRRNSSYWRAKLDKNIVRDQRNDVLLAQAGWLVVRAWEHDEPTEVARRVALAVTERQSRRVTPSFWRRTSQ